MRDFFLKRGDGSERCNHNNLLPAVCHLILKYRWHHKQTFLCDFKFYSSGDEFLVPPDCMIPLSKVVKSISACFQAAL